MILSPGHFRPSKVLLTLSVLLSVYFFLYRLLPTFYYRSYQLYAHASFNRTAHLPLVNASDDAAPSVNLVVASRAKDDTSWTGQLYGLIPNLQVLRYVSDSSAAEYRPVVPHIGREALMFLTYLYDFYDDLPDLSIFIHPHENPWHIDVPLRQSMPFALAHLDLDQVQKRGYYNLRVDWTGGCPAWINTTKTAQESNVHEEAFMAEAFRDNFGHDVPLPEILAGPCCSQFAVTRDTVRRVPKLQYQHHIDWLIRMHNRLGDYITGRVWEHLWPYLFVKKEKDCPVERDSYCRMYHICFASHSEMLEYQELWAEREALKESIATARAFIGLVAGLSTASRARERITEIQRELDQRLTVAIERGRERRTRELSTVSLDW